MNYPKDYSNSKFVRGVIYLMIFMGSLLFSNKGFATHIIGGEMTYVCLGNNNYEITLTIYRDCFNGGTNTEFPPQVPVGVFDNDLSLIHI